MEVPLLLPNKTAPQPAVPQYYLQRCCCRRCWRRQRQSVVAMLILLTGAALLLMIPGRLAPAVLVAGVSKRSGAEVWLRRRPLAYHYTCGGGGRVMQQFGCLQEGCRQGSCVALSSSHYDPTAMCFQKARGGSFRIDCLEGARQETIMGGSLPTSTHAASKLRRDFEARRRGMDSRVIIDSGEDADGHRQHNSPKAESIFASALHYKSSDCTGSVHVENSLCTRDNDNIDLNGSKAHRLPTNDREQLDSANKGGVQDSHSPCGNCRNPCCGGDGYCGHHLSQCLCAGCISNPQPQQVQTSDSDEPADPCILFGDLLDAVDIAVVESNLHKGQVKQQLIQYGISETHSVEAIPPESPACKLGTQTCRDLAKLCNEFREYDQSVTPADVARVVSHLKALQHACSRSHGDLLLVLDDGARLDPLQTWPSSLRSMVSQLPSTWFMINGAAKNVVTPSQIQEKPSCDGSFFRRGIANDVGTVATIFNLSSPEVCHRVLTQELPAVFLLSGLQPCRITGQHGGLWHKSLTAWTANLPLFYFTAIQPSSTQHPSEQIKPSTAIRRRLFGIVHKVTQRSADDDKSLDKQWALMQRYAWARYRNRSGLPPVRDCE